MVFEHLLKRNIMESAPRQSVIGGAVFFVEYLSASGRWAQHGVHSSPDFENRYSEIISV
jgi:hypothetical protein